jgi:hypothetical protein
MTQPIATIRVNADITNPGQFFACCGLLELADRLWPGAEGWFEEGGADFCVACEGTLAELIATFRSATLVHCDPEDSYSSPIEIGKPFRPLVVDWWTNDIFGAKDLKVWAGTMESYGIARAMQLVLGDARFHLPNLFDVGMVVANPDDPTKKKEPFYYDARRSTNAHSRDTGFSTNDLGLTTIAHPAVELLCLVGLQVARPGFTSEKRIYDYFIWNRPLPTNLILPAACGALDQQGQIGFRFENWFRTGQKKHKAFRTAVPLTLSGA